MKRSFPSPARQALSVVVGAFMGASACTPSHNVKPGAPELVEFSIVQSGPGGLFATTVTPTTPECMSVIGSGASCLPNGRMADAADGGAFDADVPADSLCRDATTSNWCNCIANDPPDNMGTWNCAPFSSVAAVVAVFDRLLDTAPLDPGDAAGLDDVVTTSATAGAPVVGLVSNYSSTGAADGLIFNLFGPAFFGNFRGDGPSLYAGPQPEFPSGATITVSLDATKVRAKDGTTPFTGGGLLQGGNLVFTMAPFSASVSPPPAPTMDMPEPTMDAMVVFTNFVEPMPCPSDDPMDATKKIACLMASHITATSNGAPVAIKVTSGDGSVITVTPAADAWTSGATIVITVDATVENLLGQPIDAAATATFTAR